MSIRKVLKKLQDLCNIFQFSQNCVTIKLMKNIVDLKIENFAKCLSYPLYFVGGVVRNFFIDQKFSTDLDVCGATSVEEIEKSLKNHRGKVVASYKRTGTIVFALNGKKYEYTQFRKDGYSAGGKYQPDEVEFTLDINEDAVRRDFKCNAVYYDIVGEKFVDPLGGIDDINNKVLDTVKEPKEVFSHDGLRLMRLARFCGELGFTPTQEVIKSARVNASNIEDISVERIWEEIKKILVADQKYSFSPKDGHYKALKVLDQTRVLDIIFPQLAQGRGLSQRKDYHNYDVLEHSLRCVLYAPKNIRISALLHDVAKPILMAKNGNSYGHDKDGAKIAKTLLKGLKADNKTIEKTYTIISAHMLDLDCKIKENKIRKFIINNYDLFEEILALKQADFSACKDDLSISPTVKKWREIYQKMVDEKVPFSIKQLKINATDLIELGFKGERIGKELSLLLELCIDYPKKNDQKTLLNKAKEHLK